MVCRAGLFILSTTTHGWQHLVEITCCRAEEYRCSISTRLTPSLACWASKQQEAAQQLDFTTNTCSSEASGRLLYNQTLTWRMSAYLEHCFLHFVRAAHDYAYNHFHLGRWCNINVSYCAFMGCVRSHICLPLGGHFAHLCIYPTCHVFAQKANKSSLSLCLILPTISDKFMLFRLIRISYCNKSIIIKKVAHKWRRITKLKSSYTSPLLCATDYFKSIL